MAFQFQTRTRLSCTSQYMLQGIVRKLVGILRLKSREIYFLHITYLFEDKILVYFFLNLLMFEENTSASVLYL